MRTLLVAAVLCALASASGLQESKYYDRTALALSNNALELTVLPLGGSIAAIVLSQDAERTNPLWDSLRQDRDGGLPLRRNGEVGHFVCLDGFGPSSPEERAAGMPSEHGEAQSLVWTTSSFARDGNTNVLVQTVRLPLAQEQFTRTLRVADGENVVWVHSTLESLLAFDRPVFWTEHASIGSPFLQAGATVVNLSPNRALTRPWPQEDPRHRLASNREFTWPLAPGAQGGTIDLRETPEPPGSLDQTGHLMQAGRAFAFATALNLRKHLLLGYVFKPSEYPWLQNWQSYPSKGIMARGLEFGTTVFGRPRREALSQNRMFGELLYRWLPARTSIETTFLMFWTRTPEDFRAVDDVQIEHGLLRIKDRQAGTEVVLKSSAAPF